MIMYFLYLIPPQRSLLPRRKLCHAGNDAFFWVVVILGLLDSSCGCGPGDDVAAT